MAYNKEWAMRQRILRKKQMRHELSLQAQEAQESQNPKQPPKVLLPKKELWATHNAKVITLTIAREFGVSYITDTHCFCDLFEDNIAEIRKISVSLALKLLDSHYREFCYPSFTKANFALLQKEMDLSPVECDALAYMYCMAENRHSSFYDKRIDFYMHTTLMRRIFGHSLAAIKSIFQQDNRLVKMGFVEIDKFCNRDFCIGKGLDFIFTMPLCINTLIKEFGYKPNPSRLTIEDFDYMDKKLNLILNYAKKVKNASILFYGKAGIGKSELVSAIAKHLGREVICVKNSITDNQDTKAIYRMRAFASLQHILKSDKHIVFFDECEDTICYDALERKASINTMLENTKVLNFFASNSYDMDSAFLRRFDFVCEIKAPPKSKKIAIIKSALQKSKITLSQNLLEAVATNENLTQGNLLKSAEVASKFGKKDAQQVFIKCINETLRAKDKPALKPKKQKQTKSSAMPYSMELIECGTDLLALSQNIKNLCAKTQKQQNPLHIAKKEAKKAGKEFDRDFLLDFSDTPKNSKKTKNLSIQNAPCGIRILAYGIAGSGKSEFAKQLSKECDKKLLSYKMSDLLSMFVGMTEKNIAKAFKKAKTQKAILHIDEIDSIGYNRQNATHSWERTIVNELLTQMEDYEGIFIATSNHLDCLDSAILRRFDSKIEFKPLRGEKLKKAFAMYAKYLGLDSSAKSKMHDFTPNAQKTSTKSSKDLQGGKKSSTQDFEGVFAVVENELEKLENICFGDFALIAREARFAPLKTAQDLLAKLQAESKIKNIGRGSAKVGF